MAAFSSGMPSVSVYLVLPSRIARIPASLMFSGVSKSGSPASSEMMSRPAARRARAWAAAPVVAEGLTRRRLADSENIGPGLTEGRASLFTAAAAAAQRASLAGAPPLFTVDVVSRTGGAVEGGRLARRLLRSFRSQTRGQD